MGDVEAGTRCSHLSAVFVRIVAVAAGLVTALLVSGGPAAAQTPAIVVDTTADAPDVDPDDGRCMTAAGTCSLRAAITHANVTNGPNTINFAIPGSGVKTIQLGSTLPTINDSTGPTTIDGYTQPGASVNTAATGSNANLMVEVAGPTNITMLKIGTAANVVRGLAVYGARVQFLIEGDLANGNRILGNFIGTNAAATYENPIQVTGGDSGVGVLMQLGASQNAIGAPNLADRNVISGNGGYAIRINHGESHENLIQNNVVGLNPSLTAKLRQVHGIDLQWWTWGNLIGGNGPLEANLVGGHIGRAGIELSHDARGNLVIGNLVGTMGDGNSVSSFSGNTYGIALKDFPRDNYIADNVVGGNDYGLWSKHNYTGFNTYVGNRVGVGVAGAAIPNGTNVFFTGTDHVFYENIVANQPTAQFEVNNYKANNHYFFYETYTHANRISQGQYYSIGAQASTNVATGGTAEQSSIAFDGAPGRAIDGNTNGVYNAGSITHTTSENQAWWQVDLGTEYDLSEIELFNRTDCCSNRLANFSLFVSSQPFGDRTFTELANDGSILRQHVDSLAATSLTVPVNRAGRYVRVQLEGSGFLSLAEVEVMAAAAGPAPVPPLDITPAGLNPNDAGDGDAGVQDLLNSPVITGVGPGKVFGTACANCTVEIYVSGTLQADGSLDTSGSAPGIGLAWIGTVTANGGGVFSMADQRIVAGRVISALAIDAINNTSELPPGRIVPAQHSGTNGNAGVSQGPAPAPTPLPLPTLYDYSLGTITCSWSNGTLTWTDVGAPGYALWATTNGVETSLGSSGGTSFDTPAAQSFRVAYTTSGQTFEGTCEGPDAGFGGQVTDLAGDGVAAVKVDLFSENRAGWLGETQTDAQGNYRFDVDAGCYEVTFVAPAGAQFGSGGFANRVVCAGDGQNNDDVGAVLLINGAADAPRIEATVVDRSGVGVAGVGIDLFQSDQSESRLGYLRSTTTDGSGAYVFTLTDAGCVVLTFTAPAGERFVQSGNEWLNRHVCLTDGQVATDIPATVDMGAGELAATAGGVISNGAGPVSGVQVDLYGATGDGSRGAFLQADTSDSAGAFSFTVDEPGCFVFTYIAPAGQTWTTTNTRWWDRVFCVNAGETDLTLNAVLT